MQALASFRLAFICDRLGVSRTRNYAWCARQTTPTPRMNADVERTATMREIHAASRGTYGVPRVTAKPGLGLGRPVNGKRVDRQAASARLQGLTRRKGAACETRHACVRGQPRRSNGPTRPAR